MKAHLAIVVVLVALAVAGCGRQAGKAPAPPAQQAQAPAGQSSPSSTSPLQVQTGGGGEVQAPQASQPSGPSQPASQPAPGQPGEGTQPASQGAAQTLSSQATSQPITQAAPEATPQGAPPAGPWADRGWIAGSSFEGTPILENPKHGLRLLWPMGWSIEHEEQYSSQPDIVMSMKKLDNGGNVRLGVEIETASAGQETAEQLFNVILASAKQSGSGVEVQSSGPANAPGMYEMQVIKTADKTHVRFVLFVRNGIAYIVGFLSAADASPAELAELDKVRGHMGLPKARATPGPGQPGAGGTQAASPGTPAQAPSSQTTSQPATQAAPTATPAQPAPASASGDLKVVNLRFLQAKDGPPRPDGPYQLDETIHARVDVTGASTDAQGKIHLLYAWTAFDPNGLVVVDLKDKVNDTLEAFATENLNFHVTLPPYAPPGTYKIQIKVHDVVKNTDADAAGAFTLQSPSVARSTRLEFRDFTLSHSKGGPPATPPVFQRGQTVYVSAKVAGMKFSADRLDVRIACQLVGPDSQVLMDKPDCMRINQSIPYRPATFFATISQQISLPADVPKGTYAMKYALTDKIANVTEPYQATFEVR